MKNKSPKSKLNWSLMIGVQGSTPAPLSPLKPDAASIQTNTSLQGKVTVGKLRPNQSGE
jgi:hypothetical protein